MQPSVLRAALHVVTEALHLVVVGLSFLDHLALQGQVQCKISAHLSPQDPLKNLYPAMARAVMCSNKESASFSLSQEGRSHLKHSVLLLPNWYFTDGSGCQTSVLGRVLKFCPPQLELQICTYVLTLRNKLICELH